MNARAIALLTARGQTLCCAESVTGGLLSDAFVRVPGASKVFLGSIVAYHEAVKHAFLNVPEDTLARFTAVSAQTALCMARGARAAFQADYALSATGYAGPGGADVGLVYIGYAGADGEECTCCRFTGDRECVRRAAADAAVALLIKHIE